MNSNALDNCNIFSVEEIVQHPLPDGGLDENNLSAEEKLRRERLRERGLGVTRYEWVKTSPRRKRLIVPLPAGIYSQENNDKTQLLIPSASGSPVIDPHLSPDGTKLAYVRDNELHVSNLLYNVSKQLTVGADKNAITHGVAEFIAQEEMDRKNGYWWSLDSKCIAFTEVDSSEVPLFRIVHQGKSSVGPDRQEDHAYPLAGGSNVKVRLGVVPATGGPVSWMDLLCGREPAEDDEYLARVNWMHGNILTAQVLNRTHSKLKILKFDIKTGQKELILQEDSETWINFHDCFTPLDRLPGRSSGGFIWASERTGFRHLYLYDSHGVCLGPITQGDWMVEHVAGVNEATETVYFTGTLDSPLESHLYQTELFPDGSRSIQTPVRLTHGKGKHIVVLDHQLQRFVDIYDCLGSPPKIMIHSLLDGSFIASVYEQPINIPRFKELALVPPEIVQVKAKDGTTLYGALYKPDAARFGPPPYKTMVHVYGGPSVQLVCDSWINTIDMRDQYLSRTDRRGLKFAGALKHKCGQIDAEDQLTGAEWLIKQALAKDGHIGLYGWSYGGYLSVIALAKLPKIFKCAVSGAPVTSWDGYDTFYTEKYMGLASENESGYLHSSVMHHIDSMEGKLLLVHGMIDENVHFRHTARLVNTLVAARKPYELLIFPDERHMPRGLRDRVYMEERIWDFIERSL
ncbi:hypothetical protein SASPL_125302 [Salvia splendens]|uniref:Dipeptidyl-peptidase 4 n=1 Tax=Salvia splendens TaxID=180675 RepID=A0A8X8ZQM4_SALSN|nr:hypothetical protein SASPL_125302 [Salvia splendens]